MNEGSVGARTIAAFDIGSNSIKMTVARVVADREIEEFLWRSETVRLGQNVDATGQLAEDRIEAALDALGRFTADANQAGAGRLIGVATEATRLAGNGTSFLERVRQTLGIEIQTISGDREAELTFLGLDSAIDLDGTLAVADIGGGSTEVILARDRSVFWSRSLPLGSGRLTERFVVDDPPTPGELATCRAEATRLIQETPLAHVAGGRLIVVGGTGEYFDKLIPDDDLRDQGLLRRVLERLSRVTSDDVSLRLGIPVARARVLPAGVAIAAAAADLMVPATVEAAKSGIRRGLLLAAFAGEL